MDKATRLMEIVSYGYTKPVSEKYARVILQVATLEERIRTFMSFGLSKESNELSSALVILLEAARNEFIEDEKDKDDKGNKK